MKMELKTGDVLAFEGDGIVVPTNSEAIMADGLSARLKEITGPALEDYLRKSAPIAVGAAIVTPAGGKLPMKHLIHVPVIEEPGQKVLIENIRRAARAGLLAATHFQMEKVALPGIGYGPLGIPHEECARAVIEEVRAYKAPFPQMAYLMDADPEMYEGFRSVLFDK